MAKASSEKESSECETSGAKVICERDTSNEKVRWADSPRVGLGGEDALHEGFRWHPFHRKHGTPSFPVVTGPARTRARAHPHTHTHTHTHVQIYICIHILYACICTYGN